MTVVLINYHTCVLVIQISHLGLEFLLGLLVLVNLVDRQVHVRLGILYHHVHRHVLVFLAVLADPLHHLFLVYLGYQAYLEDPNTS